MDEGLVVLEKRLADRFKAELVTALAEQEKRLLAVLQRKNEGPPPAADSAECDEEMSTEASTGAPAQAAEAIAPASRTSRVSIGGAQLAVCSATKMASPPGYRALRRATCSETFLAAHAKEAVFGKSSSSLIGARGTPALRRCVLHPSSRFRVAWDVIACIFVVWISVSLPFRMAFSREWTLGMAVADFLIDIFFMLDLVLNFFTGYYQDGQPVLGRKAIAINYIRTWFALDLAASIPIDWFSQSPFADPGPDDGKEYSFFKVLKIIKLLRLLRLARLVRYLIRWESMTSISSNVLRLLKLGVVILAFSHWNGAPPHIRAETAALQSHAEPPDLGPNRRVPAVSPPSPRRVPATRVPGAAGCLQFLLAYEESFKPDSWVVRGGLVNPVNRSLDAPIFEQYSWSIYNAVAQMLAMGAGLAEPVRLSEVWMLMVSLLLGATIYGIFVASLTAVVQESDASAREYRARVDMLNQYMKHMMLPPALREKLRAYYQLSYPGRRHFNETVIFREVSRPLREEVSLFKCRDVLNRLHVVNSGSAEDRGLATAVASALIRVAFVKGDFIIREGLESDSMYFVVEGEVEVLGGADGSGGEGKRLASFGGGSMFGEMALLTKSGLSVASVRAIENTTCYQLRRTDYESVVAAYPSLQQYIETVARLRLKNETGSRGCTAEDMIGRKQTEAIERRASHAIDDAPWTPGSDRCAILRKLRQGGNATRAALTLSKAAARAASGTSGRARVHHDPESSPARGIDRPAAAPVPEEPSAQSESPS